MESTKEEEGKNTVGSKIERKEREKEIVWEGGKWNNVSQASSI